MAESGEIHQIEYRWQDRKDLVPIASSMPPGTRQSWNAQITSWVRHPDTDVTAESVRYQSLPDGQAVLAWRYRDPQAAKRDDGIHGRPIVSRVLIADQGVLTPDIAIVLCRDGLPQAAGPRPGDVTSGAELLPLSARELRRMAEARAATMDGEAAVDPGLARLLAAAFAVPGLPLAIQLRLPDICLPPGNGPQPRLLWGMWRIGRPLLGDDGRGWSFSTFEAPLGDSDPALLPDIVFRLDQPVQHAPARARAERRVSPYDRGSAGALGRHPEMIAWLVDEYRTRGGESLGGMLAECGQGAPLAERLDVLYHRLRAGRPLLRKAAGEREQHQDSTAESPHDEPPYEQQRSQDPGPPDRGELSEQDKLPEQDERAEQERHEDRGEAREAYRPQELERTAPAEAQYPAPQYAPTSYHTPMFDPPPYKSPQYPPVAAPAGRHHASPHHASPHHDEASPVSAFDPAAAESPPRSWPPEQPGRDRSAVQPPRREPAFEPHPRHRLATASELLSQLATASAHQEFESLLQRIRRPSVQFEDADRRQACRDMQDHQWFIPDLVRHGHVQCEEEVAEILRAILFPDVTLVQVRRQVAGWIVEAGEQEIRPLIRALLLAPEDDDARRQMRSLLRSALAVRVIVHYECEDLWPSEPEPLENDQSASGNSGFRRFFRGGRD
jgi:hypothetical protein